ncbi:hypothetical protein C8J57DRAFT_1490311 [Mycena rebaudengoi]|nr:hypothetical protein C8J57DRAFT_1490311 [Mycena rebaudengoi]
MSVHISSPRAPRASHARSSSRSSPRQDRTQRFGGYRPNQPNYEGDVHPPALVPENLHEDNDTFNVDPTAAVLESGGETYQAPVERAGRRNFVGGFVFGLRKAMQRNRGPQEAGGQNHHDAPIILESPPGENQYESIPRGDPEAEAAGMQPQYSTPAPESHRRQESSTSTSETVHATQEHYEGTTVVNHEPMLPGDQSNIPVLVEPQPGSDYAKMSPPRSEASFGSYLTRIHKVIQAFNDLPWIATDRVTVDYVPGKARSDSPGPRSSGARRPILSWYNPNAPQDGIVDLLSSGTSSSLPPNSPLEYSIPTATPTAQYPNSGVYANNLPVHTVSPGPPMASRTRGITSRSSRPRRVPIPQYDPALTPNQADASVPDTAYYTHTPQYPRGGYVPYEQQPGYGPNMVQMFTGSSVASAALPPLPPSSLPRQRQQQASGQL